MGNTFTGCCTADHSIELRHKCRSQYIMMNTDKQPLSPIFEITEQDKPNNCIIMPPRESLEKIILERKLSKRSVLISEHDD